MLRSRYYYLLCGVILLTVTACASSPRNPPSGGASAVEVLKEDFKNEYLNIYTRAKLRKNVDHMLCDQPGYLACYKVAREQCLREISTTKDPCFKKAEQRFPDTLSATPEATAEKNKEFSKYLGGCMFFQHLIIRVKQGSEPDEISTCVQHIKWDFPQMERSLLK